MITTVASNSFAIEKAVREADLVIGAVLVPGAKAPKLISDDLVATMRPGSVLVDIAIDQGGCFESSRATTHDDPTFKVHDSIFYCVANMPGAVPRTSTYALTNVTLPYAVALADKGWKQAVTDDAALAGGLSTHDGHLVNAAVGEALDLEVTPLASELSGRARSAQARGHGRVYGRASRSALLAIPASSTATPAAPTVTANAGV